MNVILLISIAVRALALAIALVLLRRQRDWRLVFFVAMLLFMSLRGTLTLFQGPRFLSNAQNLTELPGLVVSFMALLAVLFLGRMLDEQDRLTRSSKIIKRELGTLVDVTGAAIQTPHLAQLLHGLLTRLQKVMNADSAVVLLRDEDGLRVEAAVGIEGILRQRVPIEGGFVGTVVATRQSLHIADLSRNALPVGADLRNSGIRSLLGVPLQLGDAVVGVLHVGWRAVQAESVAERRLLNLIAERCAQAIHNAQLFAQATQSEERLRLALQLARMGTWEWDIAGGRIVWSEEHLRIFGIAEHAPTVTYDEFHRCVHADDVAGLESALQESREKRQLHHHEFRVVWPDGSVHWVEGQGRFVYDTRGQATHMYGVIVDITERKQAEERLRSFASIIEASSEFIGMAAPDGRITYVNPAGCRLVGLNPDEVATKCIDDFYFPEDLADLHARIQPAIHAHGSWQGELRFRHFQTRAAIPMYQNGVEIRDAANGGTLALGNISHDISERLEREQALRESEGRLRAIMDHAPMHILLVAGDGAIEFVNRQEAFGVPAERLAGASIFDLVASESRPRLKEVLEEVLEHGAPLSLEFPGADKANNTRWYESHLARDSSSSESMAIVIALDITERRQAEDALRESEARFRAMCEASPVGIFLTDQYGSVTYCNPTDQRQTGLTFEETMGRGFVKAFHPDDRERVSAEWLAAVNAGQDYRGIGRYLHKNGRVIWWDVKTARVVLDDAPIGYVGICTDITERRLHEEERAQRFLQLQRLAEASQLLSRSDSLEDRLRIVTEQAKDIIGAHQCVTSLTIGQDWSQTINSLAMSEKYADWKDYDVRPDGAGIYAYVCRENKPMRLTQVELEVHPLWKGFGKERENHPPMRGWLAAPLIDRHGKNLGLIQLSDKTKGEFTLADEAILLQLAGLASAAIESTQLFDQVVEARERLAELSRQLITTQETERRHLARELHDEIGQVLTAININLQQVKGRCDPQVAPRVEDSVAIIGQAIQQVRDLSLNLRPAMLDDFGLEAALRWYFERQDQRGQCQVRFEPRTTGIDLPADLKNACFRVAQEALTNVFRHAQARIVHVRLYEEEDTLILSVHDDGVGFDPALARGRLAQGAGFGVRGMQERVELLGGSFTLESGSGHGTMIRISLPLPGPAAVEEPEEVAHT